MASASTATLVFAGDASGVKKASKDAGDAVEAVGTSADSAADDMRRAQAETTDLGQRMGDLGSATTGAMDTIDAFAGGMQALADIQDYARERASRLARAQLDVEQAHADNRQAAIDLEQSYVDLTQAENDLRQSALDVGQAEIDKKQSMLDAKTASEEYAEAVKKHGKNSDEAKQASIDLSQAQQDLKQADLDLAQAKTDSNQATVDQTQYTEDSKQAAIDAKSAQLDLNDAMHEANPSDLSTWSEQLGLVTPLIQAVVGILGLVTAAQWLWNSALFASPITWIILGIVALVAIIVLIATKTTWFQDLWNAAWGGIKKAASAVGTWFRDTLWGGLIRPAWDKILDKAQDVMAWFRGMPARLRAAFDSVNTIISAPFRAAFNAISRAWNNTVGRLSWSVPGWVPGVGGNSISAPRLPSFHSGGVVGGVPGSETLALLQAGERVIPASSTQSDSGGGAGWVPLRGDAVLDTLIRAIAERVDSQGGRAAQLGVRIV